jgi:hypothetical protein
MLSISTHALTAVISDELLLSFNVNVTLVSVRGTGAGISPPEGLSLAEHAPKKTDAVSTRTLANDLNKYRNFIL